MQPMSEAERPKVGRGTVASILGASCFVVGAVYFALVLYREDWLGTLRVACGIWMMVCPRLKGAGSWGTLCLHGRQPVNPPPFGP